MVDDGKKPNEYKPGRRLPHIWNPNNCAVRQHTGDGVSVGRCWCYVGNGQPCYFHGDVRAVQEHYKQTGELTNDYDLPPAEVRPRCKRRLPFFPKSGDPNAEAPAVEIQPGLEISGSGPQTKPLKQVSDGAYGLTEGEESDA